MSGLSDLIGVYGSMHEPRVRCVRALGSIHSKGLNHQDCEVLLCTDKQSFDFASEVHVQKNDLGVCAFE